MKEKKELTHAEAEPSYTKGFIRTSLMKNYINRTRSIYLYIYIYIPQLLCVSIIQILNSLYLY